MADLRRRPRAARATRRSIRSTPPTSASCRWPGASRPRTSARVRSSIPEHAADGQRRLFTTPARAAPSVALDAATGEMLWMHSDRRRQARRSRAAAAVGPRAVLLDRRHGRADHLRDARLPDGRAGREDRHAPIAGFGTNGIVDLKTGLDQEGLDLTTAEIGLARRRRSSRKTSSSSAPRIATAASRRARPTSRATCAASTSAPASGCGSSTPSR